MIVVNKSDGNLVTAAKIIEAEYRSATRFIQPKNSFWHTKVNILSVFFKARCFCFKFGRRCIDIKMSTCIYFIVIRLLSNFRFRPTYVDVVLLSLLLHGSILSIPETGSKLFQMQILLIQYGYFKKVYFILFCHKPSLCCKLTTIHFPTFFVGKIMIFASFD